MVEVILDDWEEYDVWGEDGEEDGEWIKGRIR